MEKFDNTYSFSINTYSIFQNLVPNGGWVRTLNEMMMTLCDVLFGPGNWLWAQYGTWIIFEGFLAPAQKYGKTRDHTSLRPNSNNTYYQGID